MAYDAAEITRRLRASQAKEKKQKKNVVRAGQYATLNGRRVKADGRGNWRPVGGKDRTPVGTYTVGKDRTATPAKANNTFRSRMGMKTTTPSGRKPKATTAAEGTFVNQKPRSEAAADRRTASTKTKTTNKSTPVKPAATKPAATKPAATKPAAKPSRPNPRMTGEGAPRPSDLKVGNNPTAKKVSRLAKALADKKGMKSYMDRLRKKNKK